MTWSSEAPLPVFPLPGLVFFPHTALPLNIFEPRYLRMVEHCLEEDSPLVMAMIEPGYELDQQGSPPILHRGGLGEIVRHVRLPDGRFHILLRGLCRVDLKEITEIETPYRQVRAVTAEDLWPQEGEEALKSQVSMLVSLTSAMHAVWPDGAQMLTHLLERTHDPAILSDCLAAAIWPDPLKRQELLDCLEVSSRLEQVLARLTELIAEASQKSELPSH